MVYIRVSTTPCAEHSKLSEKEYLKGAKNIFGFIADCVVFAEVVPLGLCVLPLSSVLLSTLSFKVYIHLAEFMFKLCLHALRRDVRVSSLEKWLSLLGVDSGYRRLHHRLDYSDSFGSLLFCVVQRVELDGLLHTLDSSIDEFAANCPAYVFPI